MSVDSFGLLSKSRFLIREKSAFKIPILQEAQYVIPALTGTVGTWERFLAFGAAGWGKMLVQLRNLV